MFRVAICDDENLFTEKLKELISAYLTKKDIVFEVDTYSSGEKLVKLGAGVVKYTVVFLDINMEKINGIKTAEMIRKVSKDVFIVFVTAYVDYSLEGYRLDVTRYLLKSNANFKCNLYECMDAIFDKMNYSAIKIEFDFKEGKKEIALERLLYIESNLHKLTFYIMYDTIKEYSMYETLNVYEARLSESGFIRIHQSYLVNAKHIADVIRYKVIMSNGIELAIAKTRYTEVKRKFIAQQGEV